MKQRLLILTSTILLTGFSYQKIYIDPTGTYTLESKTKKKGGDTYGYTGGIQVKKLSSERIVMTFEVNKDAPSYNSGSFVDTLTYKNNKAVYTVPEIVASCKITFNFDNKGVLVKEEAEDFNSGCGFGHAVIADGFYRKISIKAPILTKPLTGETIEN